MNEKQRDELRQSVRDSYAKIANQEVSGCCDSSASPNCCSANTGSAALGYSEAEMGSVPQGADMGLGCGNPGAIAAIKAGETVLDLGSGGGFDCFLAAQQVGETGRVYGVDMTPDMISKARKNVEKTEFNNVEFRLGEIEYLPIADHSVDVIISNCVINLSPNKGQVFKDAFRVLKTGGRLAISDIVASVDLPDDIKQDIQLLSGCMAGASVVDELQQMLMDAGFQDIRIAPKDESREFIKNWAPEHKIEDLVTSATIEAIKPLH